MAKSGIDKQGINRFMRDLQREFDKQGPIRVEVETDLPDLPPIGTGTGTTVNYHGPVFNGDVSGAQIAWGNDTVTQNQQQNSSAVAPGFEQLAKLVTDLLQQLPQVGFDEQDRQDAEAAANEVLAEITDTAPEPSRLRRAVTALRGVLAPVATGAVAGAAAGTQEWAQAAIGGLTGIV